MIREFRVKNFRSFSTEQVLSFEATNSDIKGVHVTEMPDKTKLLRFAIVYGPNASGKSNLIKALDLVMDFIVSYRKKDEPIYRENLTPFRFSENISQNSEFTLDFYVKGIRYIYKLAVNKETVVKEQLDTFFTQKPSKVFCRETIDNVTDIQFGSKFKVPESLKKDFLKYTMKNVSVFNTISQIETGIECLEDIYQNFKAEYNSEISSITENADKKSYVLNLLRESDYNIKDISVEKKKIPEELLKKIPVELAADIAANPAFNRITISHEVELNGKKITMPFDIHEESDGTYNALTYGMIFYDSTQMNLMLLKDEFEKTLHPDVALQLIFKFLNFASPNAQFLITSHYDPFMDEIDKGNLLADSFWFTEKENDGHTELYSLVEFNGLNSLKSIRNAYRSGQMGALPKIK